MIVGREWLFVASGFEHSIANMYYIPAGILAKCNPSYITKALEIGVAQSAIDSLNWCSMFTKNLLPVTLGNILGGSGLVGCVYWCVYMRNQVHQIDAEHDAKIKHSQL